MTQQKPTYIGGCGWWWVPGIWKKLTNCRAWRFGPTCGVDIFLGGNLGESGRGERLEKGKEDSKEAEAQKVEEKSKILIEFLTSDIVQDLNPERRSSALWEQPWSLVDLGGLISLRSGRDLGGLRERKKTLPNLKALVNSTSFKWPRHANHQLERQDMVLNDEILHLIFRWDLYPLLSWNILCVLVSTSWWLGTIFSTQIKINWSFGQNQQALKYS